MSTDLHPRVERGNNGPERSGDLLRTTTSEDITPGPLEAGDSFALGVDVDMWPHALDGGPGDVVVLVVPPGRGLAVEACLRRMLTSTTEDVRERREADTLAALAAEALA
jgi:hypothetical protein